MHIRKLSDEKILELAQKFGSQARLWRQRFIGLLPEVNRRKLYEKKFSSIFVFAYKVGGLSKKQVLRALNLEQKFADKPVLKNLFENGEVSVNKLVRVASIATPENQDFLADKVQVLSSRALETFVRDEKNAQADFSKNQICENGNGQGKPLFNVKSVHVHNLDIAEDVQSELEKLQKKGIDINELLRKFLKKREEEIEQEQQRISESVLQRRSETQQTVGRDANADVENECIPDKNPNQDKCPNTSAQAKNPSHYINVATRKFLNKKYGNKCSIATCNNLAEEIHHTQRFALSQNHDPNFLAPLCKQHHQIAHSIDQKYLLKRQF